MARRGRKRASAHLNPECVPIPAWRREDQRGARGKVVRRADIAREVVAGSGSRWRVQRADPLDRLNLGGDEREAAERWRECFERSGYDPRTSMGLNPDLVVVQRGRGYREPGRGPLAPEHRAAVDLLAAAGPLVLAVTRSVVLEFRDLGDAARAHGIRRTHASASGRGACARDLLDDGLDVLVRWHQRRRTLTRS